MTLTQDSFSHHQRHTIPTCDKWDQERENSRESIGFLAHLYGSDASYGYIIRRNNSWITQRVSATKGQKRLPLYPGQNGKSYYHLPLRPSEIERRYEKGEIIGKRPGKRTRVATIDVDKTSNFHPSNSLTAWAQLITLLEEQGLRPVVVRSSSSGGYHIILAFDDARDSLKIAHRLKDILIGAGFQLGQGQLETFPNVPAGDTVDGKVLMHGCRLPCISECSFPVDPLTLERLGWRDELASELKAAIAHNDIRTFIGYSPKAKPITKRQKAEVNQGVVSPQAAFTPALPLGGKRAKPLGFKGREKKDTRFNLSKNFRWSPTVRSNQVIGAHTAYVIEVEGITDPPKAEARVWERLRQYGYSENASKSEQRDVSHVRRWVKHKLCRLGHFIKRPGSGARSVNEKRSKDARDRLRMAMKALRKRYTFTSATQLWEAVNAFLKGLGYSGLGKRTFWKLKLYWAAMVAARKSTRGGGCPPVGTTQRVSTMQAQQDFSPVPAPPDVGDPPPENNYLRRATA
ncbi:MAG: hypothetical protein HC812_13750 [Leptolyngbya sp. RL_3_1]|nr:hypothetical protein [Leptolyngbya sp. RL_3_1]